MTDFLKRQWDLHRTFMVPADAPQVRIRELRRTFYAGAEAALKIQKVLATLEGDVAVAGLEGVFRELHRFETDCKRGVA
jgi:hypothetical protein